MVVAVPGKGQPCIHVMQEILRDETSFFPVRSLG